MTSRRSKGLSFFCDENELSRVLDSVLAKTGTRLYQADKREGRWFLREAVPGGGVGGGAPQFYAFRPSISSASLESLANVAQIWFPVRNKSELRMGEIGMLISDPRPDRQVLELQEDIYRGIRKELLARFKRGVWGRNSKTGGEHFYNDILISKDVEAEARAGLVLRPLLGDGFVTFSPDRAQ